MNYKNIHQDLKLVSSKTKAISSKRFFKTGKGEYAEGITFLGVTAADLRKIAKKYHTLPLPDVIKLLESKFHEESQLALFITVLKFNKADEKTKTQIYNFYLTNLKYVNNWDLVDDSSHKILGSYLKEKNRDLLYKLACSKSLWERRIAIITTLAFIKNKDIQDTFALAKILLNDKEDLIHKAVGWCLREVGKINQKELLLFLDKHSQQMPRTMLRYAIYMLPRQQKQFYMKK